MSDTTLQSPSSALKAWLLLAAVLCSLILGAYALWRPKSDRFLFLKDLKPTEATPDMGFSLSPKEQRKLTAKTRLFLFYQSPNLVARRLREELRPEEGWKAEDQDADFQTYTNRLEGCSAMFGTGMPRALLSGPPSRTPTCYVATVEAVNPHK